MCNRKEITPSVVFYYKYTEALSTHTLWTFLWSLIWKLQLFLHKGLASYGPVICSYKCLISALCQHLIKVSDASLLDNRVCTWRRGFDDGLISNPVSSLQFDFTAERINLLQFMLSLYFLEGFLWFPLFPSTCTVQQILGMTN